MDFFAVDAVDLDDIKTVQVGHDGEQPGAGWFLDKVVVYSAYARGLKMSSFECNRSHLLVCLVSLLGSFLSIRYEPAVQVSSFCSEMSGISIVGRLFIV